MRPDPRAAVLLLALAGCADHAAAPPAAAPVASATPLAVHVTSNGNGNGGYTVVTQMKSRRTLYTVRARSFEGTTTTGGGASGSFDEPHVTFHDRSGGATIADAPKAVLTSGDKSVVMTGGVRAQSADGNVLECDRLRYDGRTERIVGDGAVRLRTPSGLMLAGDRIDGDVRLADVHVTRVK